MHLSIVHICYGGSEACPKFDMLLIGARFSQQHGADHNEKKNKKKTEKMTAARAKTQQLSY